MGILQLDDTSNALSPVHSLLLSYDSHLLYPMIRICFDLSILMND